MMPWIKKNQLVDQTKNWADCGIRAGRGDAMPCAASRPSWCLRTVMGFMPKRPGHLSRGLP